MSNDIVKQQANMSVFETITAMAPVMHKSRLFGVSSPEQAAAIMIKSHELGLGFSAGFEFIHVIQGKPTLSPRGALALAHSSGVIDEMEIIEERDAQGKPYSCMVKGRRGNFKYETSFTLDDAMAAGLVKPDSGWTKYPANMIKWRAVGFWLDVVCPDTQGGMKRADEFGAWVDDKGDIIEAEMVEGSVVTLDDTIAEFGAEAVMNVITQQFGGNMPTTQGAIEEIRAYLSAQVNDQPAYKALAEDEE
jgi:hypothetical protein